VGLGFGELDGWGESDEFPVRGLRDNAVRGQDLVLLAGGCWGVGWTRRTARQEVRRRLVVCPWLPHNKILAAGTTSFDVSGHRAPRPDAFATPPRPAGTIHRPSGLTALQSASGCFWGAPPRPALDSPFVDRTPRAARVNFAWKACVSRPLVTLNSSWKRAQRFRGLLSRLRGSDSDAQGAGCIGCITLAKH